MKRLFAILLLAGSLAATAAAQDKPNVVGTWKLVGQADQFTASEMVISQDATLLTIVVTSQMGVFKTTYKLDGSTSQSPLDFNGMTIERATKAIWKDSKLTLTTTSDMNGQTIEFKNVMSLGADGALTVESTLPDFQGGGAPITTKSVYKKN